MGAGSLESGSTVQPIQTEQSTQAGRERGERLTKRGCRSAIVWMAGYKALTVHVYAWVCAGDGLRLRPSSMSVQVRACMLP